MTHQEAPLPAYEQTEFRKLQFEARRFSMDALIRVQLEQSAGTRALMAGHLRLMFGLSLAAIAGAATMISGLLQAKADEISLREDAVLVVLILLCVAFFMGAAVLALFRSRAVVRQAASLLLDPFPGADNDFKRLLSRPRDNEDEEEILDALANVLLSRFEADKSVVTDSGIIIGLVLAGLASGGLAGLISYL